MFLGLFIATLLQLTTSTPVLRSSIHDRLFSTRPAQGLELNLNDHNDIITLTFVRYSGGAFSQSRSNPIYFMLRPEARPSMELLNYGNRDPRQLDPIISSQAPEGYEQQMPGDIILQGQPFNLQNMECEMAFGGVNQMPSPSSQSSTTTTDYRGRTGLVAALSEPMICSVKLRIPKEALERTQHMFTYRIMLVYSVKRLCVDLNLPGQTHTRMGDFVRVLGGSAETIRGWLNPMTFEYPAVDGMYIRDSVGGNQVKILMNLPCLADRNVEMGHSLVETRPGHFRFQVTAKSEIAKFILSILFDRNDCIYTNDDDVIGCSRLQLHFHYYSDAVGDPGNGAIGGGRNAVNYEMPLTIPNFTAAKVAYAHGQVKILIPKR